MKAGENGKSDVRRVLLVGDTTLDPLARLLERSADAPAVITSAAPYGQVYQILLDGSHSAWAFQPNILIVWTAPHLTLPSVEKLIHFEGESVTATFDAALGEAEQFADAVVQAATRASLVIVPTWVLPSHERWIQTLAWRKDLVLQICSLGPT